ncbi:MAG TPA: glycine betaine ABC transporter substrate-binding protein [Blastocatellia bacterium]|nr:glycine betaine ABC transporter substrate-binding protein [Blastocatellia bacterium]
MSLTRFIQFLAQNRAEVLQLTLQHLLLVIIGTGAGALISIPVGVLMTRRRALSKPILALANILQTIPSLALFGFLIPILGAQGIGRLPALIALFLYSLLPIIRNTYTGILGVDPGVREAARGLGMTDWQVLTKVELPLSMSVILAGLRVATVISVGTATIAAAIGAGGLGVFIFRGLRMNDNNLILAGAVPAALMALVVDFALGWAEGLFTPNRSAQKGRTRRTIAVGVAVAAALILALSLFKGVAGFGGRRPVVVGSKDFTEQVILGEMLAQAIEAQGIPVERKFELGGDLCHRAMLSGEMDAYTEYTGTAYTAILHHQAISDPVQVYNDVTQEYAAKWGIEWLKPLGFNNTFAILIRGDLARRLHLKTISDIVPYAAKWRAAFGQDFMSRKDGYPGFVKAYGLSFAGQPSEMDLSLTYRALAAADVDLIAGNSTDGMIDKLDLFQLEDDRHYFPPYEAAPLVRAETLREYPTLENAINSLAGKLTNESMRKLNYEVDGNHRSPRDVVKDFLTGLQN